MANFIDYEQTVKDKGNDFTKFGHELFGWIQDIGYGVANMFGQGENANNLVNNLKKWLISLAGGEGKIRYLSTATAAELLHRITSFAASKGVKLNALLGLIDNKLGSLPPNLSATMKTALQSTRKQLMDARNKTVKNISKVENAVSTAQNIASSQDLVAPTVKIKNERLVDETLNSVPSDEEIYSIERSLK